MPSIHRSVFFALLLVLLVPGRSEAHTNHFLGPHPVAAKYGGGFCLIEAPHMHVYPPDHPNLYQRVGDQLVFTADPTPFGYEGDKHAFYGNHPVITVDGEPVICYIDGPHYHSFPAPDVPDYETRKGVAFYVGAFPPSYAKVRPARARIINAEYRPYVALRPTIEVAPPERWHGEVWVSSPAIGVVAPGVVVGAPGVVVGPPSVTVFAPPPPGIYIGGPSVEINGGMYVEHDGHHGERFDRREHGDRDDDHEHHDNGKHKGWFKHGHGHGGD
ncbi:MAG: hypothetical protein ABI321_18520 [Polyangia bacterium]